MISRSKKVPTAIRSTHIAAEQKRQLLRRMLQQKGIQVEQVDRISPRLPGSSCPASFGQERLWLLNQLEPGEGTYNIPRAFHLQGPTDLIALEQSLNALIVQHEALRTTFHLVDDVPTQVIAPTLTLAVPFHDLSDMAPATAQEEVQRLLPIFASQPFDLSAGPLVQLTVMRLTPEEHVVVLVVHHIVSDGWSMGLMLEELSARYNARLSGKTLPIAPPRIQYADFALWQREWMQGPVLQQQIAHWEQQLSGEVPVLELPCDCPRGPKLTSRGHRENFSLSPELSQSVRELSRMNGVTVFMTLLTALQILLYRYTRQEDIVVGAPISGRNWKEVESTIGFFVNVLLLRTQLDPSASFIEILHKVRDTTNGAYAHQLIPIEWLLKKLNPHRWANQAELFRIMFVLQNNQTASLALSGTRVEQLPVFKGRALFDINWYMIETPGGLKGWIDYRNDLFEPASIVRLIESFTNLLEEVVNDPQQRISDLSLITKTTQRLMLVEWNNTDTTLSPEASVQERLEAQVAKTPEAVAVICGEQELTYADLNAQANQVAHYLRKHGVGPDVLVGLCFERSADMLITIFGILKAGGGYVPLDPTHPVERLAYTIDNTNMSFLFIQQKVLTTNPSLSLLLNRNIDKPSAQPPRHQEMEYPNCLIINFDEAWIEIRNESKENLESHVAAQNLAYVMFTSGSTGKPKGVMITHEGLINYLTWAVNTYEMENGHGALVHSSLGFDLTVTSLFGPLLVGKYVVLLLESEGVEGLVSILQHYKGFSLIKLTPSHLEVLNHLLPAEDIKGCSRSFVVGGEALVASSLTKLRNEDPEIRVINEYGPTETVVGSCIYEVPLDGAISGSVPIGRPIANTQIYIVDKFGKPVPPGVIGEVCIAGIGVARGYCNRPDLTADKFIPNPFNLLPGTRMYRTGDLARLRPDGNLEFFGRIDHQVKLRGHRVELEEIETVFNQHPSVRETATMVREDLPGEQRLVAYVVLSDTQNISLQDLRLFLKNRLPEFMVPSHFVTLRELPLTSNGKLDRKALPKPERSARAAESASLAPRDMVEQQLVQIWEDLLGISPIGIRDNFFDLGGHSLLAIGLTGHIKKVLHQEIPLSFLFEHPTIEQFAEILRQENWDSDSSSPLVSLHAKGPRTPFFCVHPIGGGVLCYSELARQLGSEQPFYGIQAVEEGKQIPELVSIEDLARYYIAHILLVQKEDPYCIGGWSVGGVIAYEIAQQLQRLGHQIRILTLIDCFTPGKTRMADLPHRDLLERFTSHLLSISKGDAATLLQGFGPYIDLEAALRHILGLAIQREALPPDTPFSLIVNHWRVYVRNRNALDQYVVKPYSGEIVFFKATNRDPSGRQDPEKDWEKYLTNAMVVHPLHGNHFTLLQTPHVQTLAETLTVHLLETVG